jgi:hypothetical protein
MTGNTCGVFGSRSVAAHLLRGAIAAGFLMGAVQNGSSHPILAIAAIGVALIAMRGCPMCWTLGLVETIAARIKRP